MTDRELQNMAVSQAVTKIKTILTEHFLVDKHDVKEHQGEEPRINISMSVLNFVDNPGDLSNLMKKVRGQAPKGYGVSFSISMTF